MRFQNFIALLVFIFLPMTVKAGGGWVPLKGHGYFKISQSVIRADGFYNPMGEVIDITTVSLYTTSIYGEYGLTNRLTTTFYLPLFVRTTLNDIKFRQTGDILPGDALNSIGDFDLGFKYGLITQGPVAVSMGLTLGIPTGRQQGGQSGILQTGDGEFNQLLQLEASYPIPNSQFYISLLSGFNNRTKGFSDEIHFGAELGLTQNKFYAAVKLRGVQSLQNGNAGSSAGNTIFSNNTEYLSITPEISYGLGHNWGITGAVGFAASGQNILASPNYQLGAYLKL